jgi:catechol 2,3-dioxygenase-like lactoylglutathione lyase family enzyme
MDSQLNVHVALNVKKFAESVSFYRAMLGVDPVKLKPGYAKFAVTDPPLNLTLNYAAAVTTQGALNHLGIQVPSSEQVLRAKERLEMAGLKTSDEMNVDCCYALQDKVWVTDPNGYRWEIFTVKIGDTQPDLNISFQSANRPYESESCCRQQQPATK